MSNFLYSFKLASIKFKQKGFRNSFAIFSLSLGSLLILVILIGLSGLLPFAQKALKDPLYGKYIARYDNNTTFDSSQNDTKSLTIDTVKEGLKEYPYKKIFEQTDYNLYLGVKGLEIPKQRVGMDNIKTSQIGLRPIIRDFSFVSDSIENGYSFDYAEGEAVPVLLNVAILMNLQDDYYNSGANIDINKILIEGQKQIKEIKQKYLGKELEITLQRDNSLFNNLSKKTSNGNITQADVDEYEKKLVENQIQTGQKIKIVGFVNYLNGIFDTPDSLIIPSKAESSLQSKLNNVIAQYPDFSKNLAENYSYPFVSESKPGNPSLTTKTFLVEFNSKAERINFIKNKYNEDTSQFGGFFSGRVLDSGLVAFENVIETMRNIGLGIGVFLLIIGCLFSISLISKEISDSQKEIGLYRALGATKGDVRLIYFSYSFILSAISFIVSLILAYFINILISIWANDFIYLGLISFASKIQVDKPIFILVGLPILEIILTFLFILGLSLLFSLLPIRRISKIDPIKVLKE